MTDQRMFSWREHVQSARLPSTTKLVLLTLSTHMTRMGESCFPTTRQIAWECSLSRVSVMKHLADAEKLGWITRSAHGFAGQRWKNHEYKPSIPTDAKIVLWHESEDGIQAEKDRENSVSTTEKAGQPPLPSHPEGGQGALPPHEKAGQAGLPPLDEAGQPPYKTWSTSRGKVVKEVDLSSSIAHQVGVHDNNISAQEGVSYPTTSTQWLDWLVERFGYLKHRVHNSSNMAALASWAEFDYTIDEAVAAVLVSIESTGKDHPPIRYVTEVLHSNRLVKIPKSKAPEHKPGYESPTARAERMVAEDQAAAARRQQEVISAT